MPPRRTRRYRLLVSSVKDVVLKHTRRKVHKKLERSEPYRMFMSPIKCDSATHTDELTLSFQELLDRSLGVLAETLHLTFMVELDWLLAQYILAGHLFKRKTLIYSRCNIDIDELHSKKKSTQIIHKKIKGVKGFGYQHSNVSMFAYKNGSLRVVVTSANLTESDWINTAQGIWVSPKFPLIKKGDKSDGNSKTDFKIDILRYLKSFEEPSLIRWIRKIERVDFSQANVFFIPSVPGEHKEELWGHLYLKSILKKHACLPFSEPSEWPIIAQCSSLGSLGTTDKKWLIPEFIESLSASTYCGDTDTDTDNDPIPFNLIFPAQRNVFLDCRQTKDCYTLSYNKEVYENQLWLNNYMHLWSCYSRKRSKVLPNMKTYCRISSCLTKMSWFLLTSANLSKAAWGRKLNSDDQSNYIMAYEAGVLFLPQFLIKSDTFPIDPTETTELPYFSLPFDLPLTKYNLEVDEPYHKQKQKVILYRELMKSGDTSSIKRVFN